MGWIPGQLEQLRLARKEDAQRRGVEAYATPCNMVMALMAQVGELADIFQYQDDSPGRTVVSWSQRDRRQLNEGLADVLLSLVSLSDVCQNDLGSSAQRRLTQVTRSSFPQHTGVPAPSPTPTPTTQQQHQQQQPPLQHVPPVFPERRQLPDPQQQAQPAPVPAKPAAPAPAPAPVSAASGPVHHPTPYHAERAKELAAHTAMREREAGAVAAAAEAAARQRQQERQHEQHDRETSASVSPPLPAMVPCPIFPVSSGEDVRASRRHGGSSAGGSGSGGGGGARRGEDVLCPLLPEHAGQGKSKAESCHSVPQKHSKGHSVMCASNSGSSSATHSTVWSIAPSPPMSPLDEKELLTRTRTEAIHNAVAAAVSAAAAAQQRQVPNGTAAAASATSSPAPTTTAAATPAPTTSAAPETSAAVAAAAAAYLPPPQPKRGLRRTLTVVLPKTSWADEEKLYSPTHFDKDLFSPCVHQGELTFDAGNMPTAAHRKTEQELPNGCVPAASAPTAAAPRKVPSPSGKGAVSPAKSPINHTRLSRFLNKDPPDACRSDQDVASDGQSIASDGGASFTDFSAVLAELERGASEWPQEDFDEMEVTFSIPYNGQIHDLLPDGRHMKVQFERLPDYVALARHKLAVLQTADSSRGYIQAQREQRTSPSASPVNK